jgi:hypothetical protein
VNNFHADQHAVIVKAAAHMTAVESRIAPSLGINCAAPISSKPISETISLNLYDMQEPHLITGAVETAPALVLTVIF